MAEVELDRQGFANRQFKSVQAARQERAAKRAAHENWMRSFNPNTAERKDFTRFRESLKDQALKEKLEGSKAFTHNNGRPFDGADFFRLFTGLIEVPKKYKQSEGKITDKDIKEYSDQFRAHFLKIKRTEMLNPKDTWDLFMKQPYTKTMREDDINFFNDLFRDDADLTFERLTDMAEYYGRCPCSTVLNSMSKIKFSPRLTELQDKFENYFLKKAQQNTKTRTQTKDIPKSKSTKK